MQKLTREKFYMARDYIYANANDIQRAWYRYHFEDGNANAFMDVLARYQHENGGFGGLSDEFEYQGSCLKCTEHAFFYIHKLNEKPSATHPVIQKMMKYVMERYIPEIGNWGAVEVPEINDGVHCRWARFRGNDITPIESEDERINQYGANEHACFAGFIAYYSEIVPEELYQDIIKYPIEHILRYWDENSPDYKKEIFDKGSAYDFEYFQWFVSCLKDKDIKEKLTAILRQNPTAFVKLDFTKAETEYVHLPSDSAINSTDTVIKQLVEDSLTYRMNRQSENSMWPLGWSYGDSEGLRKLQAISDVTHTINMLITLRQHDKIEL